MLFAVLVSTGKISFLRCQHVVLRVPVGRCDDQSVRRRSEALVVAVEFLPRSAITNKAGEIRANSTNDWPPRRRPHLPPPGRWARHCIVSN